jgi:hypothetical protein
MILELINLTLDINYEIASIGDSLVDNSPKQVPPADIGIR